MVTFLAPERSFGTVTRMSGARDCLPDLSDKIDIAIVCSPKLGDALIMLGLAKNLVANGLSATLYSDHLSTMGEFVDQVDLRPIPATKAIHATLERHDEVLYDRASTMADAFRAGLDNHESYVCYSLTKGQPDLTHDHWQRIQQKFAAGEKRELLLRFANCNCLLREPRNTTGTMVDNVNFVSRKLLKLPELDRKSVLQNQSGPARSRIVVIHPTSTSEIKNWLPERFLELAERIEASGYQAVITVAPYERDEWLELASGKFDVPLFPDIRSLARFYSSSFLFVGADAGNAHLAAALGVPCFVILNRRKKYYRWRPGWGEVHLVLPPISRRLAGNRWKNLLSVEHVYRAVMARLAEVPVDA